MKRSRGSSDSLSGFLPIRHSTTDKQISPRPTTTGFLYSGAGDYSQMFDALEDDGSLEDLGGVGHASSTAAEKKRRLGVEQVKALEKNFEIDNKLEPERKVKLAQELGLQPRQVAIWFQNRRARWKTKQLERDYGVLKSNFDALKRNRDSLQRDNDSLLGQIKELKAKLNVEGVKGIEENGALKAVEANQSVMANNEVLELSHRSPSPPPHIPTDAPTSELAFEMFSIFPRTENFRDDPADSSDSSAVLNEEYSPNTVEAAGAVAATTVEMSTMGCFSQFVKMEEHEDLFSGEEACKLFADNEQWYCSAKTELKLSSLPKKMPLSNNVIGCINFITVLLSIPVIGAGIWLAIGTVNSCVKLLQWPVIILGVLILLVGLAGFIGGFWRITWLLVVYLIAMLILIVLLGCLVGFIYMVTIRGSGHPEPSRAYLEYSLQDFSGWLRRRVQRSYKWERIRTCLSTTTICPELNQRYTLAQDFFNAHLDPIQSGCCKPPTKCGFTFVNPTYWISPIDMSADMDCLNWSNDQNTLCYTCDSCKAGLLANIKVDWLKADIFLLLALIGLIIVYIIGCCAFRNAETEDIFRKYKQGYT